MTVEEVAALRELICELLVLERKLMTQSKPEKVREFSMLHTARLHISEAAATLHPLVGGPEWLK